MENEDGSLLLTFNGEIYNHLELREDLIVRGHRFRSRTDSEVLLHLFEEHGTAMLQKLDGMYAFVLYDRKNKEIFAARDRFGKKPFYYANIANGFYWASEFRSLVQLVPDALEEDLQGFYHYVTFNCYPREFTFFKEIRKLLPGHSLKYNAGNDELSIRKYYQLAIQKNSDSSAERDERLRQLFSSAVKKRLMSDVPIGFYLSGGIDSSSIVMQASEFHSPISTFSIALEDDPEELDETPFARLVADRCGAEHHEIRLTEREYAEGILETSWALDEPVNLADAVLLNQLTKLAAGHGVKVLMSGEGSDEVFFGYPHYDLEIRKYYRYLPIYRLLPNGLRDNLKAMLRAIKPQRFDRYQLWLRGRERFLGGDLGLTDVEKQRVLAQRILQDPSLVEWSETLGVRLQRDLGIDPGVHISKQMMLNEFNVRLPDFLLTRVDRVSMANSVEARNPFLDRELVEYATSIPFEDLYDGRRGKVALRRALQDLLPREIRTRGKVGFGGSLEGRDRPAISALIRDVIGGSVFLEDYFSKEYLHWLVSTNTELSYETQYARRNIAVFALWKHQLNALVSTSQAVEPTRAEMAPIG